MPHKQLFNFRDLGGLETRCGNRVRPNELYRSGNLGDAPDEVARYLAQEKRVGLYIDFRAENEIERFGRPEALIKHGVEWVNLHIDTNDETFNRLERPTAEDWVGLYVRLLEKNIGEWERFARTVAEFPKPVVYGCLFGKDRTGIATSLLLNELNVRDEHIVHDYTLSRPGEHPYYARLRILWEGLSLTEEEIMKHFLSASPEIIKSFLELYRSKAAQELRHVSQEITANYGEKLRRKLLEPKR